jgi:hypothetical protein
MVTRYAQALWGCLIASLLSFPAHANDLVRQHEFYQYVLGLQHHNQLLTRTVHNLQQQNLRLQWELKYGVCESRKKVPQQSPEVVRRSDDGNNPRSWQGNSEDD